jgi:flagellar secretion chaperone FliS
MDAKLSYREAAVTGASPVRLVICLYEQVIEDLRHAAAALEKRQIELRTRKINHAIMVLGQLQGSLDMERGADVARNLEKFYNMVRLGLVEAQAKQSAGILEQQIAQLEMVCDAWLEVERASARPTTPTVEPAASPSLLPASEPASADWSA